MLFGCLFDVSDVDFLVGFELGLIVMLWMMCVCYLYLKGDGVIVNFVLLVVVCWDVFGYGVYVVIKEVICVLMCVVVCEWGVDGICVNVVVLYVLLLGLKGWIDVYLLEVVVFFCMILLGCVGDCE